MQRCFLLFSIARTCAFAKRRSGEFFQPPVAPDSKIAATSVAAIFSLSKKSRRVCDPQAANSVQSIFRGGVYVAKNTLRGESVFSRICARKRAGRSEIPFVKKERRPFLTSSIAATAVAAIFAVQIYFTSWQNRSISSARDCNPCRQKALSVRSMPAILAVSSTQVTEVAWSIFLYRGTKSLPSC